MAYFFLARRWKRVLFSIFLCFFLRMRLRRFLINEPIGAENLLVQRPPSEPPTGPRRGRITPCDCSPSKTMTQYD